MVFNMRAWTELFLVAAALLGPLVSAQEQNVDTHQGPSITIRPGLGQNQPSSADNIAFGTPKLDISNIIPVEDLDVHIAKTEAEARAKKQQGTDISVGKGDSAIQVDDGNPNVVNDGTHIMFIGDRKKSTTLAPKPKLKFKTGKKKFKPKQKGKLWKQVQEKKKVNKGRNKNMVRIINDILEHIEEHNNRNQGSKLSTSFIRNKLWSLVALKPKPKKIWGGNIQRVSVKPLRKEMRLLKKKNKAKKEKEARKETTKHMKEKTLSPSTFRQTSKSQSKATQTMTTKFVTKSPKNKKKNKNEKKKNKKQKKKNKKVKGKKKKATSQPIFTVSVSDDNQTNDSNTNDSDKAERTSKAATKATTIRETSKSDVVKQETTTTNTNSVTDNTDLLKSTKGMKASVTQAIKNKKGGKLGKRKNNKKLKKQTIKNKKQLKKNKLKKQKANKKKSGKITSKT